MTDHRQWAEFQIRALMDAGLDLMDAQRSIKWVLDNLPEGADPATWVPTAAQLETTIAAAAIMDARVDWYAKEETPPQWKRLLDAR